MYILVLPTNDLCIYVQPDFEDFYGIGYTRFTTDSSLSNHGGEIVSGRKTVVRIEHTLVQYVEICSMTETQRSTETI